MSTQVSTSGRTNVVAPIVAVIVGIVLVIVGQYVLDHLADTSDTWHNIQHGTFLLGGVVIGIGGTLLWASGRRA
jgi:hypothetical protein